jgi:hypothetical protein
VNQEELKILLKEYPEAKIKELNGEYYLEHLAPNNATPIKDDFRKKITNAIK